MVSTNMASLRAWKTENLNTYKKWYYDVMKLEVRSLMSEVRSQKLDAVN